MSQRENSSTPLSRSSVLERANKLLTAIAARDGDLSVVQVAREVGLPKATASRLISTLESMGLLRRTAAGTLALGIRLFELGIIASSVQILTEIGAPYLQELFEQTKQTIHLGVPHNFDVIYMAKISGHRRPYLPSRTGGRLPAHCTAIGKVLLAYRDPIELELELREARLARYTHRTIVDSPRLIKELKMVRTNGVAYEFEESAPGVCCIAAPVFGSNPAEAIASISVAGYIGSFEPNRVAPLITNIASKFGQSMLAAEDSVPTSVLPLRPAPATHPSRARAS